MREPVLATRPPWARDTSLTVPIWAPLRTVTVPPATVQPKPQAVARPSNRAAAGIIKSSIGRLVRDMKETSGLCMETPLNLVVDVIALVPLTGAGAAVVVDGPA